MAQSDNENIRVWKQRAAIDYVPPFMNLWLWLNAWMNNKFPNLSRERDKLNSLKKGPNLFLARFTELISTEGINATSTEGINATLFRSSFAELHRALINAQIPYHRSRDNIVRFDCCLIDWASPPNFESILVQQEKITINSPFESSEIEQEGIKLDDDLWIESNTERLFKAYIEIVYQVRCNLFHGDLVPDDENHRVIRLLYLTLFMIMEDVG